LGRRFPHRLMGDRNPYEVLGVSRNATDAEIKRVYRKLSRQYHPDRNKDDAGAESKFKEVQSAFDAIGTAEARREYDQHEQMSRMFGGGRAPPGGRGGFTMNFGGSGGGGLEDILGQMFGGGAARGGFSNMGGMGGMGGMHNQHPPSPPQERKKAADIHVGLDLSMEDALKGGQFEFSFKRFKQQGTSMETKRTTMKLRLEAGVAHGTVKKLAKQGHDHPEGERGDVIVTVRIDAGEHRRWEDQSLIQEVPIAYSLLMLGGKADVRLPSGKLGKLTIQPLSQIGDRRRMAGAGYNGGDLTLEFVLNEIETLSEQQRSVLESLGHVGL